MADLRQAFVLFPASCLLPTAYCPLPTAVLAVVTFALRFFFATVSLATSESFTFVLSGLVDFLAASFAPVAAPIGGRYPGGRSGGHKHPGEKQNYENHTRPNTGS